MGAGGLSAGESGLRMQCTWLQEIKSLQDSFTKYYLKERKWQATLLAWLCWDCRCTMRFSQRLSGKEGNAGERASDMRSQ